MKFKPALVVQQIWAMDPGRSGRSLATGAKKAISQEKEDRKILQLHSLPHQGGISMQAFPR